MVGKAGLGTMVGGDRDIAAIVGTDLGRDQCRPADPARLQPGQMKLLLQVLGAVPGDEVSQLIAVDAG